MTPYDHRYAWKNNEKRKILFGRRCRILQRLTMNSIIVEFENGSMEVTSRYAVRKLKTQIES